MGVILTGCLDDGTSGLIAIKRGGGTSIIQDPAEALFPSMPLNALKRDHVDYCVRLSEMPQLIESLVNSRNSVNSLEAGKETMVTPEQVRIETQFAAMECIGEKNVDKIGRVSPLTCPECGGSLWEIQDGEAILRFRCHVGHAYTAETLVADQVDFLERALGSALRALEEIMRISDTLAEQAERDQDPSSAEASRARGAKAKATAATLREILLGGV